MSLPFSFVFIFILLPVLAIGTLLLNLIKVRREEERQFSLGIKYLKNFRRLLTHVQQHRGLTNSYLSGNLKVEADVSHLENNVAQEILEIEAVDVAMSENAKWDSIKDHWNRLNKHYSQLTVETNMRQHNILISNILYLIDDLSYHHHLGKVGLVESTDTDWRHLLTVAENVGQVRALGMGVVSRGVCSSVSRIQLNHLKEKITLCVDSTWGQSSKEDFAALIKTLDERVIVDSPNVTPEEYFSLATRCIDHVLREFDAQVERLQFMRA